MNIPMMQTITAHENRISLGYNVYVGSQKPPNPQVGIIAAKPKVKNMHDRILGLIEVSLIVAIMHAMVQMVRKVVNMYLQMMKGPQAYLKEMNGYNEPRNRIAIPQQSIQQTLLEITSFLQWHKWQVVENPRQKRAVMSIAIKGHLVTTSPLLPDMYHRGSRSPL